MSLTVREAEGFLSRFAENKNPDGPSSSGTDVPQIPFWNGPANCAHKKGEVVEPAGGETGGPRCLAEVRKLLVAALFRRFRFQAENVTYSKEPVKEKNKIFGGNFLPA